MTSARPTRGEIAILLAILALALGLRAPLMSRGFHGDELWTVLDFVEAPTWWEIISRDEAFNNHHFYSLLARLSEHALGQAEWVVRLPALLFGLLLIPLIWLGLRREFGRGPALFSALLLATSSIHIGQSVSARGYTGLIFFTWCGTLLFIGLLRNSGGPLRAVLYAVTTALGIWTHLYAVPIFAIQGLILGTLVVREARARGRHEAWDRFRWPLLAVAGAAVLTALFYAPALPAIWLQLHGPRSAFQPLLPVLALAYLTGRLIDPAGILLAALALAGLVAVLRRRRLEAVAFDPNSADPPTFPNDGSLAYRRIGAIATDAEGRILAAEQEGDEQDRRYRYQAEQPVLAALREGTAVEFTPFDLAPFLHRYARRALVAVQPGNGVAVTIARDPRGAGATLVEVPTTLPFEAADGESPTVAHYRNAHTGGSATIAVLGFEETL